MLETAEQIEEQLELTNNTVEKIDLLNDYVRLLVDRDPQKGLAYSQQAYELAQLPPPYTQGIYHSLLNLAASNWRLGNIDSAMQQAMQAYSMAETQNSVKMTSYVSSLLGALFKDLGEYKDALNFYLQALAQIGEEPSLEKASIVSNLGIVYHFLGDFHQELAQYDKALEICRQVKREDLTASLFNNIAMSYQALGDLDTAVTKAQQSLQVAQAHNLTMVEANTLCTLGELHLDKGDISQARRYLEESAELASSLGFRYVETYSIRKIGEVLTHQGKYEDALPFLQRAANLASQLQHRVELAACHQALAQSYKTLGDPTKALEHFEKFYELDKKVYQEQADRHIHQLQIVYQTKSVQQEAKIYKQKTAELDTYARSVAHDLKQPVAALLGYSELLLEMQAEELPDMLPTNILEKMAQSAEFASQIIDALLLLATIDKTEVNLRPINMETALGNVLLRLQPMIEQHQGRIILPDTWETAVGYQPWVEEIWANYLSNGLKYGGEAPVITISCEPYSTNMIRYWVKDNGPGIPLELSDKLFDELKRPRLAKNSHGFGLSIVRRIVDKLGGTAGFKSEPAQGSQFFFTLPRTR
ncbi:MAG: tetratricopeptide repeat protein [Ardenticatenaceae bacterium]|nr:tetratricopeptide repeat protein [Ardenticatenaceae bacterium]